MPPAPEAQTKASARFYRDCGWNALPSRMDRKGPALNTYADFWDKPLPDAVYEDWRTTNIQVMTGTHWRLCVVDCDGEEAHNVFRRMKEDNGDLQPYPTWVSKTGGGGWHYWFTLPNWLDECPSRRVWGMWDTYGGPKHEDDWANHKEIRILGDRSLVIAPPSVHVKTGEEYHWLDGRGPQHFGKPAPVPAWVLDLPEVMKPELRDVVPSLQLARPPVKPLTRPSGAFPSRDDLLAAIPDTIALAKSWGLRLASQRPNQKGFVSCYAVDRDESNPSASFHDETGMYMDMRDGTKLGLFDLAAALGAYPTWLDAKADLAGRYAGTPARTRTSPSPRRDT